MCNGLCDRGKGGGFDQSEGAAWGGSGHYLVNTTDFDPDFNHEPAPDNDDDYGAGSYADALGAVRW